MKRKSFVMIGALLAATIVPFSTFAESRQDGLEACVDALALQFAEEGGLPVNVRIDPESLGSRGSLGRREVFHMDARDVSTGEIVARADCTVNARARVRSLDTVPLNAADARDRAVRL